MPLGPSKPIPGRQLAFSALELWERAGKQAESALEERCLNADPRERRLAYELTLGVLRWLGRLDSILANLLRQPLSKLHPSVRMILRMGLHQLRHLDRIPHHAVVNESVELCQSAGVPWAKGLVNGVLRRYLRERDRLEALPSGDGLEALASRYAHPVWMVRAFASVCEGSPVAWLEANNQVPPLTLRANTLKLSRETLMARLAGEGSEVSETRYSPVGIHVLSRAVVSQLPGYSEGHFAVQDEASQLVALVVDAQEGELVLDACAAPGGKALHLAAMVGDTGQVYATDASTRRLTWVREAAERLAPGRVTVQQAAWGATDPSAAWGANGGPRAGEGAACLEDGSGYDLPDADADVASGGPERALSATGTGEATGNRSGRDLPSCGAGGTEDRLPQLFDRVLVDAPCSGLGVLRRIPEIKWRRTKDETSHYPARQSAILNAVATRVRPGGTLVYSVCTPLREEGVAVAEDFLSRQSAFRLVDLHDVLAPHLHSLVSPGGYLQTYPHRFGCDAFFVARFERRR